MMTPPLPLSCTMFEGQHGEEQNALRSAIMTASIYAGFIGEYAEYDRLKVVARTSMTVELVDALYRHGYRIVREER